MNDRSAKRRNGTPLTSRRKVLFSLVASLFGLTGIELSCRLLATAMPNSRWRHHEALVETIGFSALNEILEPDSELFWRLRSDIKSKPLRGEIGDSADISFTVSTDSFGRRVLPDVPDAEKTVLFLGDSCTFGVGVDDDKTFAALLQDNLPDTRCTNNGVPGYSSYQGLQVLKALDSLHAPDVVVIAFLFNDDSSWDGLSDLEHAKLQNSLGNWLIRTSRFADLVSRLRQNPRADTRVRSNRPRLTDTEYAEQLRQLVEVCRERLARPILLVWPLRNQMERRSSKAKQNVVRFLGQELDVPVVDLVPEFRAHGGLELFVDVVHANQAGNRLVADALRPVLIGELNAR